jgi:uncharacterized protein (DUF1684 family)
MEVPDVTGDLKMVGVTHQAVSSRWRVTRRLRCCRCRSAKTKCSSFFRDRTSGRETYGAGRFLKVPAATTGATAQAGGHGKISLDFNRAYNPPCAFTSFATCPLPPPENWLPFPVLAGEKKWQGGK